LRNILTLAQGDEESFKGSDLVGLEYEPLFQVPSVASDKAFKVYPADFVTTEDGTGIVHTAVVYGEDDYNLGMKVGLPVVPLLDEKGTFNDKAPELVRGMYFKDSEKIIKKDLESRGLLFAKNSHTHSYPHCWRCGTTLFYNAIPAWFMNIQKIKPGLLKTNDKEINWYPEHLKHGRYQKSVEAAPDWNISRNRYWGNPIPVWKCANGHNTVVGSIKELGLDRNNFYFARHGESTKNVDEIVAGSIEHDKYDLTEKGIQEAEELAKYLDNIGGVDVIISSDFRRASNTAQIVAKHFGVEIKTDKRLREINVGVLEGVSEKEFQTNFVAKHNRWTDAPEGGETWQEIQNRMVECIEEINKNYEGKNILIVSHGDPLWLMQQHYGKGLDYPPTARKAMQFSLAIKDLHRPYIDDVVLKCKECGQDAHRTPEIFDSWVEAGSMPFAEYHYPFDQKQIFESRFPAQFVAEYIAQTRAWFYVMHVVSFNLFGHAPFENVVTTGTILAEDGSKMSKSKNNFPDPWKVIEQYGVDALRFYLMNSPVMQADNLNFSEKELGVTYRKNILILWNVFNYFVTYANDASWEPKGAGYKPELTNVLDLWIVAKTQELVNQVTDELDGYNTVRATRAIEEYINELSTWYLRRSRGRRDDHFFGTMRHCLLVLAKVMAPVTPYISEIIYKHLKQDAESVHLMPWPAKLELAPEQKETLDRMNLVRQIVENGHGLRSAAKIKLRQPLSKAIYTAFEELPKEFEEILAEELNVKAVEYTESKSSEKSFFAVDIVTEITPELKKEGLAAELTRAVQDMRKKTGLKVGEVVNLTYDTDDGELIEAFELVDTKKTYINEISQGSGGDVIEIEGKKITIKLSN
jgi:isoleucyl-tRNA synthetase